MFWLDRQHRQRAGRRSLLPALLTAPQGIQWSQPNLARVRRLIAADLMMPPGLNALGAAGHDQPGAADNTPVTVAADIRAALRSVGAWNHYEAFPQAYPRIRIAWIEGARRRPTIFATRLRYFVKMTARENAMGCFRADAVGPADATRTRCWSSNAVVFSGGRLKRPS